MAQNTCPQCQQRNAPGSAYCANCGAALGNNPIILRREDGLTIAGYDLPAEQLKRIGTSVAVSLTALVAEAVIIWLGRRVQRMKDETQPTVIKGSSLPVPMKQTPEKMRPPNHTISVYTERVIEERRWGRPVRRIVERMAWRRDESSEE